MTSNHLCLSQDLTFIAVCCVLHRAAHRSDSSLAAAPSQRAGCFIGAKVMRQDRDTRRSGPEDSHFLQTGFPHYFMGAAITEYIHSTVKSMLFRPTRGCSLTPVAPYMNPPRRRPLIGPRARGYLCLNWTWRSGPGHEGHQMSSVTRLYCGFRRSCLHYTQRC